MTTLLQQAFEKASQLPADLQDQLAQELEAAYQHMAQNETREAEALAWSEATVSDVSDAPR